jgi:hypothetical protein
MDGFILRVTAYSGEPVNVGGLPFRAGTSRDTPVTRDNVVNDPINEVVRNLAVDGTESDYELLNLIEDFEDEYGCKVNIDDPPTLAEGTEGTTVFGFDIFEPAWADESEADDVTDDLTARLVDWCSGYPTGR